MLLQETALRRKVGFPMQRGLRPVRIAGDVCSKSQPSTTGHGKRVAATQRGWIRRPVSIDTALLAMTDLASAGCHFQLPALVCALCLQGIKESGPGVVKFPY